MGRIWVADTEPNARYTLYTRGNVGEVFPHVVTPLTGTLTNDAVERAQRWFIGSIGVLRPDEMQGPSLGIGVFGGYHYANASVLRLGARRTPGVSARSSEQQLLGDLDGLPPHEPAPGDRDLVATLQMARTVGRLVWRPDAAPLVHARADALAWLRTAPDLRAAPDAELLAWVAAYPARHEASMRRLLAASLLAGASRSVVDELLAPTDAPPGLANRVMSGTGDVDSTQLARQLWALGRIVAADPALGRLFDAGTDGIGARLAGTALAAPLRTFLVEQGHRANDEYELANPSWAMDPAPVLAAVERLRHAPADRDPAPTTRALAADAERAAAEARRQVRRGRRAVFDRAVHAGRVGAVARERAKDVLVLESHGARRILHELARRAAARGGPADVPSAFCVTFDELAAFVATPGDFASVIAARDAQRRDLDERVPPPWFVGRPPDPSTWPRRSEVRTSAPAVGAVLTGIPVSGGVARGPARVVTDPGDPRGLEPGDVLVCAITDPSWTPLFLSTSAVVCDSGALQSHAAIVARELGIPAVMSVPGITAVADGTVLTVDGTTGTVTVR